MLEQIARNSFKQLFSYILPHRLLIGVILALVFFMIILELGVAWIIKEMTDYGIKGEMGRVLRYFFFGLLIFLFTGLNNFAKSFFTGKVAERTVQDIKQDAYRQMQRLPIGFFEEGRSGDLLSHFSNDINMLLQGLKFQFIPLLENPLMALFSFLFLFFINWRLALICLATGPLTYFVGRFFAPSIMQISRRVQGIVGESNAFLSDSIQGVHIVKSFGLEEEFSNRFNGYCQAIYQGSMKRTFFESSLNGISFFVGSLSFMLTFGFGIIFIIYHQLTVGELWAFIQLINRVIWPFSGLASIWGGFMASLGAGGRIFNLFDVPIEPLVEGEGRRTGIEGGQIQFKNVYFSYDDDWVLKGMNFSIEPGEVVAFVGVSGAGKSTIFKLLLGFYPVTEGEIILDGDQIRSMAMSELRSHYSFVSQDVYLFHGSIMDNIGYGRLHATREEIEAAARTANAHDFITALPAGYQTQLGEGGVNLSGGEKQRISIARALLKDARILLFDEPTAALDRESERLVQEALEELVKGRTTLVIAHRLSTVITAHKIIVIDDGKIEEVGAHERLLATSPTYRRLFQDQLERCEAL